MSQPQEEGQGDVAVGWRLKFGAAMFVFSILLPVVGVPLVTRLDLSTGVIASVSGALLVSAEILGVSAIAVMGKSGYAFIKDKALAVLKRHGPPQHVGRRRYTIGLVMFSLPIVFGWLSVYAAALVPVLAELPLAYAVALDVLFLASFFVLGGDFWDKIRGLFLHEATSVIPDGVGAGSE